MRVRRAWRPNRQATRAPRSARILPIRSIDAPRSRWRQTQMQRRAPPRTATRPGAARRGRLQAELDPEDGLALNGSAAASNANRRWQLSQPSACGPGCGDRIAIQRASVLITSASLTNTQETRRRPYRHGRCLRLCDPATEQVPLLSAPTATSSGRSSHRESRRTSLALVLDRHAVGQENHVRAASLRRRL